MTQPSSNPIRVLVVEDSLTVRRHICDALSADPELEVVGEAEDGKHAIELCLRLRPDVITMDMVLPIMDGLATTEYLMAHCPTPILIVSSSTNRGELLRTYEALGAGAVDVLDKPSGEERDGDWEETLRTSVRMVSRIRVITHLRGRIRARREAAALKPTAAAPSLAADAEKHPIEALAIGASTGGPSAVVEVLGSLSPQTNVPILLVLHIGERFGSALVEWLDAQTSRRVTHAVDGEPVARAAGRVLMAPAGVHLEVRGGRVHLTDAPARYSCRPSVDVLFESAAREYGSSMAACLLTGMGRDGAAGLLEVRKRGGLTIAQDEATSVIYGMPREAALLHAAEHILPLSEIGPVVSALTRPKHKESP